MKSLKSLIKNSITNFQNTEDEILYIATLYANYDYTKTIVLTILSTIICCLGINFESQWLIIGSLIFIPFSLYIIQFTIGIYQWNFNLAIRSYLHIFVIALVAILTSFIFFKCTPFAYRIQFVAQIGLNSLSLFFSTFIIGLISLMVLKTWKLNAILIFNIFSYWLVFLCLLGFSLATNDYKFFIKEVLNFKLGFCFFYFGLVLVLFVFNFKRNENVDGKQKFGFRLLHIFIICFGVYFGAIQIYDLTTKYNVEKYVRTEFESKSFVVNAIDINKSAKEVIVFYTGIRPALTQDVELKKRYKIESYHIVYQELK